MSFSDLVSVLIFGEYVRSERTSFDPEEEDQSTELSEEKSWSCSWITLGDGGGLPRKAFRKFWARSCGMTVVVLFTLAARFRVEISSGLSFVIFPKLRLNLGSDLLFHSWSWALNSMNRILLRVSILFK